MEDSKLWQILAALSVRERGRFQDYLASPFFSAGPAVQRMYQVLLEDYLYTGLGAPGKEAFWVQLHPKECFDDVVFRTRCSQLLKQVEGFLVQVGLQQSLHTRDSLLLGELEQRRLDRHLHYALQRTRKALATAERQDEDWSLAHYQLERAQYQYDARQEQRSQKLAPLAASESLDAFYLASRLRLACELRNLQHILQLEHDVTLSSGIQDMLEQAAFRDLPAVSLYAAVWRLLEEDSDEAAYRDLRERILHDGPRLAPMDQQGLYIYAINYCIRQANRGETHYLAELLGLYREALERGVLFAAGSLAPSTYKNIVTVGLRVGEYPWVRSFIRRYRSRLPAAKRENAYTYNLAKYYFTVRRYDDVLPLLREVEYDDVFYALDAKVMLLKVYYETGETDALFSLFDSFAVFLRRNKILSAYHKTINLNFIKLVKRLAGIVPGDRIKLRRLQERIETKREISDITWLLDRVKEKEQPRANRA